MILEEFGTSVDEIGDSQFFEASRSVRERTLSEEGSSASTVSASSATFSADVLSKEKTGVELFE